MITIRNIVADKVDQNTKGKIKYYYDNHPLLVEELAIKTYESEGCKAIWSENNFWSMIMAILFWDCIFAKVRGAVAIHKDGYSYNIDPNESEFDQYFNEMVVNMNGISNDFFSDEFYSNRESIINNKIQELTNSNLVDKFVNSYEANYGKLCRPIEDWQKFSKEDFIFFLSKLDSNKVIRISERLLKDFINNRSGLPDLIVSKQDEVFFSEVKSEKDKLSDKQIDWHSFLSDTLDFNVDIFLVNHSERQSNNIINLYNPPSKQAIISFGYSSSKKLNEAVEFISKQPSYVVEGEGKDAKHTANFDISKIESLYKMLDLTTGWKTQYIQVEGQIFKLKDNMSSLVNYVIHCGVTKKNLKKMLRMIGVKHQIDTELKQIHLIVSKLISMNFMVNGRNLDI